MKFSSFSLFGLWVLVWLLYLFIFFPFVVLKIINFRPYFLVHLLGCHPNLQHYVFLSVTFIFVVQFHCQPLLSMPSIVVPSIHQEGLKYFFFKKKTLLILLSHSQGSHSLSCFSFVDGG